MKRSWVIRKDDKAVSPVIATILMVAITVVLAAVLYVMVTGLLAGPGASRPQVTLGTATAITDGYTFQVAGVSQNKPANNYRINFQVDQTTSTGGAQTLTTTAMSFTVGANTYSVTWADPGGEGSLTGGDTFSVTRTGGLPSTTSVYKVLLLWSDGSVLATGQYPP